MTPDRDFRHVAHARRSPTMWRMHTETATQSPTTRTPLVHILTNRHFVMHYAAMVVAMVVGMIASGPLWSAVLPSSAMDRTDVSTMTMATGMVAGMAGWMLFRRHTRVAIVEMSAAMYLPFVALLVPYWFGLVGSGAVMGAGHLLMLVAMAAVMVRRPEEYAHHA